MLILTRSVGEVICIGNDIKLVVVSIKGNQVRLGVQAPRHVTVDRQEIADRKAQGHRVEAQALR